MRETWPSAKARQRLGRTATKTSSRKTWCRNDNSKLLKAQKTSCLRVISPTTGLQTRTSRSTCSGSTRSPKASRVRLKRRTTMPTVSEMLGTLSSRLHQPANTVPTSTKENTQASHSTPSHTSRATSGSWCLIVWRLHPREKETSVRVTKGGPARSKGLSFKMDKASTTADNRCSRLKALCYLLVPLLTPLCCRARETSSSSSEAEACHLISRSSPECPLNLTSRYHQRSLGSQFKVRLTRTTRDFQVSTSKRKFLSPRVGVAASTIL